MELYETIQHLEQAVQNLIPSDASPAQREHLAGHYRKCMRMRMVYCFEKMMKRDEEGIEITDLKNTPEYLNFKRTVAEMKANSIDCPCAISETDDPDLCEAGNSLEYALKKWLMVK